MERKQARALARMATKGEDQIRQEKIYQLNDEKRKFLSLSLPKRLKYFYDSIPTKKAKRVFWFLLTPILPMVIVYAIINICKLDIAWSWSKQMFHTVKK
tara:strand:- start:4697 stop:4993 length:297 start_codon:yes stop_codon:yes gene_type:complete